MERCGLVRAVATILVAGAVSPALAQEPASAPLAAQLSSAMQDRQLDAVAGKDAAEDDRYVAALAFPGQLLVVSARYEAPVLLDEKITNGEFREVYIDLNAASIAGSKVLVTDLGANGLRGSDETIDTFDDGSRMFRLDGAGSGGQMSSDQYQEAVAEADAQYSHMLEILLAQAR